jgi:hypothetical protein
MGQIYAVNCSCGFDSEVVVGGGMRDFRARSTFPFYCGNCGIVHVNVSRLPDGVDRTKCPKCRAEDCTQYGVSPVSLHDMRPKPWWYLGVTNKDQGESHLTDITLGERRAGQNGHLCPKCKSMNLRFSLSVLFD